MWHSGGQRTPLGVHLTFQFLHGLPYCAGLHTPRQPRCQCARTQVVTLLMYKDSGNHAASVQGLRQPSCQCTGTQIATLLVCKDSGSHIASVQELRQSRCQCARTLLSSSHHRTLGSQTLTLLSPIVFHTNSGNLNSVTGALNQALPRLSPFFSNFQYFIDLFVVSLLCTRSSVFSPSLRASPCLYYVKV